MDKKSHLNKDEIHSILMGDLGNSYRLGTISKKDFWGRFINKLGLDESPEVLEDEWINGYELISETKDLIDELSKKYKVYFLSDNVKERVERLNKKHNFVDWFEDGIFSHEAGVKKPDPQIYNLALSRLNADASTTIFIDDDPKYIKSANSIGIYGLQFSNPRKIEKKLQALI